MAPFDRKEEGAWRVAAAGLIAESTMRNVRPSGKNRDALAPRPTKVIENPGIGLRHPVRFLAARGAAIRMEY